MKPLYIFDLDGTLALTEHRQHLVQCDEPDWEAFFRACVDDEPNIPVINTLAMLSNAGADIWIWSGRSDAVGPETRAWLTRNGILRNVDHVKMRREGDYTPDNELKLQWLHELSDTDEQRLIAIFDDRDKVVKMWRENGVPCFQVAEGSF